MASTRLPGKPLADIAGVPMIVHVLRRAQAAGLGPGGGGDRFGGHRGGGGKGRRPRRHDARRPRLRLRPHLRGAGGDRPRAPHPTSSSTCRATCRPSTPADIRAALEPLDDPAVDIATLAAVIARSGRTDEPERGQGAWHAGRAGPPACALLHPRRRAEATARSITTSGSTPTGAPRWSASSALPPSPIEQRERLEQLRALDAGMRIDVAIVNSVPLGVDTPEDLEKARKMLAG